MGKPYSQDLRRAVVRAIADGCMREEVAEAYEVSLINNEDARQAHQRVASIRASADSTTRPAGLLRPTGVC
jgi:transposase